MPDVFDKNNIVAKEAPSYDNTSIFINGVLYSGITSWSPGEVSDNITRIKGTQNESVRYSKAKGEIATGTLELMEDTFNAMLNDFAQASNGAYTFQQLRKTPSLASFTLIDQVNPSDGIAESKTRSIYEQCKITSFTMGSRAVDSSGYTVSLTISYRDYPTVEFIV